MMPQQNHESTGYRAKAAEIFGQLNRPIWIVTAASQERRGGLVATWVTQASIDPERPALMAGLASNHFTRELVAQSGALGVHLLRRDQLDLVWNFALGSGRDRDKLAHVPHQAASTGSPILVDCCAWMDCQVRESFDSGDRTYFLADVVAASGNRPGNEILRESDVFSAATADQRARLQADMQRDVQYARQLLKAPRGPH